MFGVTKIFFLKKKKKKIFFVIQNTPKRINYIMKYLDRHLDYNGQSSLIM